jgi:hypothetical protein
MNKQTNRATLNGGGKKKKKSCTRRPWPGSRLKYHRRQRKER